MEPLYNYIAVFMTISYCTYEFTNNRYKYNLYFLIMFGSILLFFSAFRFEYGFGDYYAYIQSFYRISAIDIYSTIYTREIGYQFLQKMLSLFSGPQAFFVITAIVVIFSFCKFFYKYSLNPPLSLFLFYTFGVYFTANNITRQFLAIAICLFSYRYVINKKFFHFIITIAIASLFHISALITLIIYPLCSWKITYKTLSFYLMSSLVLNMFFSNIMQFIGKFIYNDYIGSDLAQKGANLLQFIIPCINFLCVIIPLCKIKNFASSYININITQRIYTLCVHMVLLDFVFSSIQIFHTLLFARLGLYFKVGFCIFYPFFIICFVKNQRLVATFLVMLAGLAYFFVCNYYGKLSPTPYDFFWNHVI